MGRTYFIRMNATMLACAVFGAATIVVLLRALPDVPPTPLSRVYKAGAQGSLTAERRATIDRAHSELRESLAARLLTGPETAVTLERESRAFAGSGRAEAAPIYAEQRLAAAVDLAHEGTLASAIVSLALFGGLGLSGLLGFLRLKVRAMTILSCSLLGVFAGAGGAGLAFLDLSRPCVVVPTVLCTLGLFGQLMTTNLLPDSNHPFIVQAEAQLRALTPDQRRRHLVLHLGAGLGLATIGVLGTFASLFLTDGPVFKVFTGAFAFGLIVAVVPLTAAVRLGVHASDGRRGGPS